MAQLPTDLTIHNHIHSVVSSKKRLHCLCVKINSILPTRYSPSKMSIELQKTTFLLLEIVMIFDNSFHQVVNNYSL